MQRCGRQRPADWQIHGIRGDFSRDTVDVAQAVAWHHSADGHSAERPRHAGRGRPRTARRAHPGRRRARALHPGHDRRSAQPELSPAARIDRARLPAGRRPRAGAGRRDGHVVCRIDQPRAITRPTPGRRRSCWRPPYYFPAGQPELLEYVEDIVGRAAAAGVPVQHAQPHQDHLRARDGAPGAATCRTSWGSRTARRR